MGSAICSCHEEEEVFPIAKGNTSSFFSLYGDTLVFCCMLCFWDQRVATWEVTSLWEEYEAQPCFFLDPAPSKYGGAFMVKDQCPMHTCPPASLPPPSGMVSCSEVRNSWVFKKLEFLQHIDELAKTEGGFSCPSVAL